MGKRIGLLDDVNDKVCKFKNKITLSDIQHDIEIGVSFRNTFVSKVEEYNDLRDITGKEKPKKRPGRSAISTRLVRRQAEWKYPVLSEPFNGMPELFTIHPKTYDSHEAARQHQILLNHQFTHRIDRVSFVDQFVRHLVDDGFTITKVGWKSTTRHKTILVPDYKYTPIPMADVELYEELSEQYAQLMALQEENPAEFNKMPSELVEGLSYTQQMLEQTDGLVIFAATQIGVHEESVPEVVDNQPTVDIIDISNFFVDPNCGYNFDDAMFCGYTYKTTLAELIDADVYKNLDQVESAGDNLYSPVSNTSTYLESPSGKNRELVEVTEYWAMWDIEGNGQLESIVVSLVGNIIIRCIRNPFPDNKFPFVVTAYMPIKDSIFGEANAELIGDNQRIASALDRSMIDTIGRSANAQTAIRKDALDIVNRRRFERGEDFEINPTTGSIGEVIQPLQTPEISQSALILSQQQSVTADALTGIKSYGDGMSSASLGDVAAGIKGVLDAATRRDGSDIRRMAQGFAKIGAKIIAMNAVFLSDYEVVRVTNEADNQITYNPDDDFKKIYRDDLYGAFDVTVDITTAEENMAKAQDLAFMMQTLGPTMGPEITTFIMSEIAELKNMPMLAHTLRTWQPPQDPIGDAVREAEVQLAQAKALETQANASLKAAQAEYYKVLASRGQLDFIEQESGTKQERELQLRAEQANSQITLAEKQAQLKQDANILNKDREALMLDAANADAMSMAKMDQAGRALDALAALDKSNKRGKDDE